MGQAESVPGVAQLPARRSSAEGCCFWVAPPGCVGPPPRLGLLRFIDCVPRCTPHVIYLLFSSSSFPLIHHPCPAAISVRGAARRACSAGYMLCCGAERISASHAAHCKEHVPRRGGVKVGASILDSADSLGCLGLIGLNGLLGLMGLIGLIGFSETDNGSYLDN